MRTSRPPAWLVLVGGLVLVVLAVLLTRLGTGGDPTVAGPTSARSATTSGPSGATSSARRSSGAPVGPSSTATDPVSHLRWVDESSLDTQATGTLATIRSGGPYRYPRNDGVTYHNVNGALPSERDGYYREYTVATPGTSTRGPRRIVSGEGGELYYTTDHYETFRRIRTRV